MAQKQIIWSKKSEFEFRSILEFYNQRNGNSNYSLKIVDATEKLLKLIQQNNYLGKLSNNKKTRVINLEVFLIFYDIADKQISIVSFWDNRQNPQNRMDSN